MSEMWPRPAESIFARLKNLNIAVRPEHTVVEVWEGSGGRKILWSRKWARKWRRLAKLSKQKEVA